jgi:hypothetical protein
MVVPKATMPGIAEAASTRGNTMSVLNTIAIASLLIGLQVAVAVADGPPKFDLAPTCNAAVRFAIVAGRDKEACLDDEHTAESTLAQNWSKYNATDKTQCIGNVKTGGPASYVELLSCLEIMRDAKEVREGDPLIRSNQPVQSAPRRRR